MQNNNNHEGFQAPASGLKALHPKPEEIPIMSSIKSRSSGSALHGRESNRWEACARSLPMIFWAGKRGSSLSAALLSRDPAPMFCANSSEEAQSVTTIWQFCRNFLNNPSSKSGTCPRNPRGGLRRLWQNWVRCCPQNFFRLAT